MWTNIRNHLSTFSMENVAHKQASSNNEIDGDSGRATYKVIITERSKQTDAHEMEIAKRGRSVTVRYERL